MARRRLHLFETINAPQTSVGHFCEVPSGGLKADLIEKNFRHF